MENTKNEYRLCVVVISNEQEPNDILSKILRPKHEQVFSVRGKKPVVANVMSKRTAQNDRESWTDAGAWLG
jgi:hypothetical protein